MTATKEERIAYLEKNGPDVSLFDYNREISIILLRDGKEEHHTFFRNTIEIMFPQSRRSRSMIPNDAPDYFIYAPTEEIIPLSKNEAEIIAHKMYELTSAADAEEAAAAEADKECGYCGEKLGDCYGDHEEDDDRASITSTELRVDARILAMEAEAKMNNEVQQEKQAVQNEWASGRQRIMERHAALVAAAKGNEVQQEKQAVQNEWASGRQRILARHEALLAEEAAKQVAERARQTTEGYKY